MFQKSFSSIKSLFNKILLSTLILFSFTSLFSVQTNAQNLNDFNLTGFNALFCVTPNEDQTIGGQTGCNGIFNAFIDALISFAPVIAIFVMVWGGYLYFIAGFNGESAASGIKAIRNGFLGLLIVLAARAFIRDGIWVGFTDQGFQPELVVSGLAEFINDNITDTLITISTVVAVLVIIWGGYKYFFGAFGSQETGAQAIRNGFIGLFVSLLARPLITAVFDLDSSNNYISATNAFENGDVNWAQSFAGFVVSFLNGVVIPASSIFALFAIILGGYKLITARDDSVTISEAYGLIRNGVIGLVVVLLAFSIVQLVVFLVPVA